MATTAASEDKSESSRLMVCAIDFGTSFTGFAYSFKNEYKNIRLSTFRSQEENHFYEQTPTCLLLNPDQSFYKFGYEATYKYKELLDDEKDEGYFYFDSFKMKLYETKSINEDVKIPDCKKNLFPAIDIFTKVLRYLREEIIKTGKRQCAGLQDDDILWVLTVPAIWSDSAKSFMRKAAVKAGYPGEYLILCLEPEAASLLCLSQNACRTTSHDGSTEIRPFPEGQKYIIADLGGGTADLSVHEILEDRNLREIRRSDGGPYGGNMVNNAFMTFLEDIFGKNVMTYLKRHNYGDIMEIITVFERKKKFVTSDTSDSYRIDLPLCAIKEAINDVNDGESFEVKVKKAYDKNGNNFSILKKDAIEIKRSIIEEFFSEAVDGIVGFIKQMRKEDELNEINIIFMVGGFSESTYIQDAIKKRIPGLKVYIPEHPSLAVVKGAVLMGHKPHTIISKISRFTYGLSVLRPFREGVDPEKFKIIQNGIVYCDFDFLKLVEKGQIYRPGDEFKGEAFEHRVIHELDAFATLSTSIYRSEKTEPEYADVEYECEVGAEITIPAPTLLGWPPLTYFMPKIVLGLSEITVKVFKTRGMFDTEGDPVEATLEFM